MGELTEIHSGMFTFDPAPLEGAGIEDLDSVYDTDLSALAGEARLGLRLGSSVMAALVTDMSIYQELGGQDPSAHRLVEDSLVEILPVRLTGLVKVSIKNLATERASFANLPFQEGRKGFVWLGEPVPIDWEKPVRSEQIATTLRDVAHWTALAARDGFPVQPGFAGSRP